MEENKLHKKYGIFTAISMVVGTVIGSGIFFKASKVLAINGGSVLKSFITVFAVGLVMLSCSYVFSLLASRVDNVNGLIDYSETAYGEFYAYLVGWFCGAIFYPTITSCLSWITAKYILMLFGIELGWWLHYLVAALILISSFLFNILSPVLAGKFQVSTTVIKLIPLLLMALVGTLVGLFDGTVAENLTHANSTVTEGDGLFSSIIAFAFAYEGWIFTTSINSEIKDSKKNLPRALFFGAIIIIAVYVLYFFGLMGVLSTDEIINAGDDLPRVAFSSLFGSDIFGTIIYVFVIISCLGTTNGLMLVSTRGMYSVAVRGRGIAPAKFAKVNEKTNMPIASAIFGLAVSLVWLTQWQLGFINGDLPEFLRYENDELTIAVFYLVCIPMFIYVMRKCKDLGVFNRFVMPSVACLSAVFMIFCAIYSYRIQALYYFIVFAVLMAVGALFYRTNDERKIKKI